MAMFEWTLNLSGKYDSLLTSVLRLEIKEVLLTVWSTEEHVLETMAFGARTPRGCLFAELVLELVVTGDRATAAADWTISDVMLGWFSRAFWRSQMYSMTFWMTSNLDNRRFFGMKGTSSFSLDRYIWISSFSRSRLGLWTRPLITPLLSLALIATAFILKNISAHKTQRNTECKQKGYDNTFEFATHLSLNPGWCRHGHGAESTRRSCLVNRAHARSGLYMAPLFAPPISPPISPPGAAAGASPSPVCVSVANSQQQFREISIIILLPVTPPLQVWDYPTVGPSYEWGGKLRLLDGPRANNHLTLWRISRTYALFMSAACKSCRVSPSVRNYYFQSYTDLSPGGSDYFRWYGVAHQVKAALGRAWAYVISTLRGFEVTYYMDCYGVIWDRAT